MKTLQVQSIDQWRDWLDEHQASVSEIWLVFYKRHAGGPAFTHGDALDEALCIGWVDSLVRRLADRRYAIKFTPRRPDSRWSDINRKRYAQLKAAGRMKPAGIERAPTHRRSVAPATRLELPSKLPSYIRAAFDKHPVARRHFDALAPSHRRQYFAWIESAKREETKRRRLGEAIRLLAKGKQLGLK